MAIGNPIDDSSAQSRQHAYIGTDNRTPRRQPPMAKGILDAFHHATALGLARRNFGNRRVADRQLHDFRNSEQAEDHGNQGQIIDQIIGAKIKPGDGDGFRIADG